MKTVLFFSLFVIGNVFGLEGEFDGSPRIKARKVKDITSAEMCADACQSKSTCLIWKYNKKTKRCIINLFKAKPNPNSTFGRPTSALPPPTNLLASNCPEGWSEHEGSCYKLNSNVLDWNEAQTNCMSYEGGNLASIHSVEEGAFVEGLMEAEYLKNGEPTSYWLGAKYDDSMDEWEWSDGSIWWLRWFPGGFGKCLQIYKDSQSEGWLLSAMDCTYREPYVCKIQG